MKRTLCAILALSASACGPAPGQVPSASQLLPQRPASAAPAPAEAGIDLLDKVRVDQDAVAGTWGFHSRSLWTSQVDWGRLQLPVEAPEEYDLHLRVVRRRHPDALNLGFVIQGRQAMLVVDGWGGKTTLLLASGPEPVRPLEEHQNKALLQLTQPHRLELQVRRGAVGLKVDGTEVLAWKGNPADLKMHSETQVPNPRALSIGTWNTVFEIQDLRLVPVTGQPKLLRG